MPAVRISHPNPESRVTSVMHTKDRVAILQMETTLAVLGQRRRSPALHSHGAITKAARNYASRSH